MPDLTQSGVKNIGPCKTVQRLFTSPVNSLQTAIFQNFAVIITQQNISGNPANQKRSNNEIVVFSHV